MQENIKKIVSQKTVYYNIHTVVDQEARQNCTH